MNHEFVNCRIDQLPIAMAGLVHAYKLNGTSLSTVNDTVSQFAKRRLP